MHGIDIMHDINSLQGIALVPATFESFVASLKNRNINFRGGGGRSKAVWNFSENSSILKMQRVPKGRFQKSQKKCGLQF